MKKLLALVVLCACAAGCGGSASQSGVWEHETLYKNADHLRFSLEQAKQGVGADNCLQLLQLGRGQLAFSALLGQSIHFFNTATTRASARLEKRLTGEWPCWAARQKISPRRKTVRAMFGQPSRRH